MHPLVFPKTHGLQWFKYSATIDAQYGSFARSRVPTGQTLICDWYPVNRIHGEGASFESKPAFVVEYAGMPLAVSRRARCTTARPSRNRKQRRGVLGVREG